MMNILLFLTCRMRFCFRWLFGSRMCMILETHHYLFCLWGGVFYYNRGFSRYRHFGFGSLCIVYLVFMWLSNQFGLLLPVCLGHLVPLLLCCTLLYSMNRSFVSYKKKNLSSSVLTFLKIFFLCRVRSMCSLPTRITWVRLLT